MASTLASSNANASSSVVAAPIVLIPSLRASARISLEGMPNIKLNTAGRISNKTSTCFSNLEGMSVDNSGNGIFNSSK